GDAEQCADGWDIVLAEASPADHAARLPFAAAQRRLLEGAADKLPLRDDDVEAGQDGQLHPRRDCGIVFDLARNQHLQHQAALAVADQNKRSPTVLRREIIAPGCGYVAVGEFAGIIDVRAGGISGHRAERHLTIDGSKGPTYAREARELDLG